MSPPARISPRILLLDVEALIDDVRVLRALFFQLNKRSETLKNNDYIFMAHQSTREGKTDIEEFKSAFKALQTDLASIKSKAEPETYATAKETWGNAVRPHLKSDSIFDENMEQIRVATKKFYSTFGVQFE